MACATQPSLQLGSQELLNYTTAVAKILEYFPSCSEVSITLESCQNASIHLSAVLPVLGRCCRLQHLSQLDLCVTDRKASAPTLMSAVLSMLRLQLPSLQCLQLSLNGSWADSSLAWQALGLASHLTKLAVSFDTDVTNAASLEHLSYLSSLSNLANLSLNADDMQVKQTYSALQQLPTSLTNLSLPLVEEHEGLASISSCSNLQSLQLDVFEGAALHQEDCAALAQLLQLTSLDARVNGAGSDPHFLSALRQLSQLQQLTAHGLTPATLPCLVGLRKLTQLCGEWSAAPDGSSTNISRPVVCRRVIVLEGKGTIPFASFPNVEESVQWDTWAPATLAGLAQHCKQLAHLNVHRGLNGGSLSAGAPVGERTAAIRALASLQHLQELAIGVNDDAELAAVAAVTCLTTLCVILPAASSCTLAGLHLLMRLRQMQHLTLELCGLRLSQQDAQLLLCCMQHVKHVHVLHKEQIDEFVAAVGAAQAGQFSAPAEVELEEL